MKRVALVALLLMLTACGGDPSSDKAGSPLAGSSPAPDSQAAADGGNPVDGKAFCDFLEQIAPRLKADGSAPGAKADLAIELANWIEEHPTQKPRTASDLDDVSQKTCPKTRTTVVATMGAGSFSDALG